MRKRKRSQAENLYIQFRDLVDKEKLNDYDNEYLSQNKNKDGYLEIQLFGLKQIQNPLPQNQILLRVMSLYFTL
jgi:hypothetical protein